MTVLYMINTRKYDGFIYHKLESILIINFDKHEKIS